ncbi:MAG: hypothetical protein H0W70_00065 [Actinobacteria bacterium]|nr:hypothetical protein [Actinomycetota bacterium]
MLARRTDEETQFDQGSTWHGKRDVRVDTVPDPKVQAATDAIIQVTSSRI